ncbi:hypothetical protein [Streptomyces sp. SID3343]|uniref:hypothetical protein n=1 Tax=Streptomyces sp. SID3343 TaxID=2690260 RepID=UPI00136CC206|nr:hypothetical protein [Streptomyces sp. SID3343]MYV99527.1 hypothetical protein [Streptomyces sp. SID3343]
MSSIDRIVNPWRYEPGKEPAPPAERPAQTALLSADGADGSGAFGVDTSRIRTCGSAAGEISDRLKQSVRGLENECRDTAGAMPGFALPGRIGTVSTEWADWVMALVGETLTLSGQITDAAGAYEQNENLVRGSFTPGG